MPYTRAWDETQPPGTALAASLDTIIQNFKTDTRERVAGIFGLNLAEFTADPIVPKSLALSVGYTGNMTGNVTGNVTGNLTGSVLTAAQPNITSLGTLSSLVVAGNVSLGGALVSTVAGRFTVIGGTTGITFANNANNAANLDMTDAGAAVFRTTVTATTGFIGTLNTAAQPNITSLGVIAGLATSGTVAIANSSQTTGTNYGQFVNTGINFAWGIESSVGGTLFSGTSAYAAVFGTASARSIQFITNNAVRQTIDSAGNVVFAGTVTASNFVGPTSINANALTGTTLAANVVNSSLTSVGILVGLGISGVIALDPPSIGASYLQFRVAGASKWALGYGVNTALAFDLYNYGVPGSAISVSFATNVVTMGAGVIANVTGNLTGTVLTAAQPNITSLGALTTLTVTGTLLSNSASSNYLEFDLSSVAKAFYGISGSASSIITGSVAGDAVIRSQGFSILLSVDSGATIGAQLKSTGQFLIGTTSTTGVTAGGIHLAGNSIFDTLIDYQNGGQSTSPMRVRINGNAYEFGHTNAAGYGSTIGAYNSQGWPFIAFSAEAGTTTDTFKTRGNKGTIIVGDIGGGLVIKTVPLANADNQTATNIFTLSNLGAAVFIGAVSGITTLTATTLVGTLSTGLQTNITRVGTLDTTLSVNSAALVQSTNQGTGGAYAVFINTGGTYYIGVDNSTGAIFASGNYNFIIYTPFGLAVKISPTTNLATFSAGITLSGGVFTGNVTGNLTGNVTGTILTAAQGNITSLGTLTALTVSGLSTFGTGHISQGASTSVSTVTTIYTIPSSSGAIVIVYGSDGTNIFIDEVLVGDTAASVALAHQFTIAGAPATRTYSISSGLLRLAMSAGTYTIKTMPFYVN